MRRMLLVVMAFFISSSAHAFDCKPGRYVGKSWSANEVLHNKEVIVVVAKKPSSNISPAKGEEGCEFKFKMLSTGADEIWELYGNKLIQQELDSNGKEKLSYAATLEVRGGIEGYYINCEDKCEGNADRRSFWKIENKNEKIVYTLWGVDPNKAEDPNAAIRKRVEYVFIPVS